MNISRIKARAEDIYKKLQPYCIAIYLGGSMANPYIKTSHDIDFICFSEQYTDLPYLYKAICKNIKPKAKEDFIQIRCVSREEHSYGSYINKLMIPLAGKKLSFNFDVINKDRSEYISILKETAEKLNNNKIKNKKRWYQILMGIYILENNSYKLNDDQIKNINILHDQQNINECNKLIKEINFKLLNLK